MPSGVIWTVRGVEREEPHWQEFLRYPQAA
jgi:hypothetical protein